MESVTCPKCGKPMTLRTKKNSNFQFYGCTGFPACNGYKPFSAPKVERKAVDYSGIVGSPQQIAFWNAVKELTANLILRARAGSGKTFTITYILSFLTGLKIAFFAFNRTIANELKSRVPESVVASTLHAFGLAQIKCWNSRVQIDEYKLDGIIDEFVAEDDNSDYIKAAVKRLVELCKFNLIDGTNEADLDDLVLTHNIDLNDHVSQVYTIVPQVLRESRKRKNVIDFTDMLWFVYAHNIPVENFDVVIADEIQDFNPLQRFVAFRSLGNNGRFIGVGDDRQAIYGFAGASVDSMNEIIADLEKTQRGVSVMPLSYSRRSPVSHIELAKMIVDDIEALPDARIGSVESIAFNYALQIMTPGAMGIARRNAPLITIAYSLIREGKPVLVRGRDIGKGLQALIRKLRANTIETLIVKAEQYRERELSKLDAKGKKADSAKVALNDKIDTLIALTDGMSDLSELRAKIDSLFSDTDDKGKIVLSTVHKAKGLEATRVFIFDYARIRIPLTQPWQQIQESNLEYIALTRSTDELYLID